VFVVMALLVGALYAAAFYLLLARSTVKLIFGLLLLGHAANLLIFAAGGLVRAKPAIVPRTAEVPLPGYADPIPQALILTAIVISFAVLAFAAVLVKRAYVETGTDDSEEMRTSER
jgi:multicomponent Na+:H+ antiporter subunit C